ncbi:MAG: hypothetical protein AABX38_06190 [Candidatus Micrarchaeota archaeon]
MSKGSIALFGGIGSFLGLFIGFMIEFNTPDGFSCLPLTGPTEATALTPVLKSFFACWTVVLICTGVLGAVGAMVGQLTSQIGGR